MREPSIRGFAGAKGDPGDGLAAAPCTGPWRLLFLGVSAQLGQGWLFAVLQAASVATG